MELSGSLRRFAVANVFQLLAMEGATGLLTLKRGRTRIIITLRDGDPLDVEHTDQPKDRRIEEILTVSGRITKEDLESALEEHRSRLMPLGLVLRDRGIITAQEQRDLAVLIYTQILFEALQWRDGRYDFERQDSVEVGELEETLSIQMVQLNAAQQEDEWPQIRRLVPTMDAVFTPSPSDSLGWTSTIESLPPEDRRMAERIDGVNSVRLIAYMNLRSEFEVARLVAEFVRRGLVVRVAVPKGEERRKRMYNFFTLTLRPASVIPMALAFAILLSIFVWRNYVGPAIGDQRSVLTPILHGGRDAETVDRLRLQRLLRAFQIYRSEFGSPVPSLAVLARLGYCDQSDLRRADGSPFLLKVISVKEERAIISAAGAEEGVGKDLSVEISLP